MFLAVILIGSLALYQTVPVSFRCGIWGHNVLVNWQDFGFYALKGQLVYNPGGYNLPDHPLVYAGHRAFGLYPAYFVDWLFGGCDSGRPFYVAFSLVIGISVWWLLGLNLAGMVAAICVIFSPIFTRMVPQLDLFAIPIFFGIPFLGGIRGVLEREKLTLGSWALILGIVTVYAPLNWTTIGAFTITLVYLAVALQKQLKNVLLFALIVGVAGLLVLGLSLASKVGGGGTRSNIFSMLYNTYLFGPLGYDKGGMTWIKAITRLMAANVVGLLPLWLFLCWVVWTVVRWEKKAAWSLALPLLPLVTAVLFIGGLRNYFAHHPWMAGPVIICGIVFSARLLIDRTGSADGPHESNAQRDWFRLAVVGLVCFAYGFIVVSVFKINQAEEDEILLLAKQNTTRRDVIFFSPKNEPWIAQLPGLMDRALLPFTDELANNLSMQHVTCYELTGHALPGKNTLVAQTEALPPQGLVARLLGWYRTHIAKRTPGDRLEAKKLYLYKMQ